MKLGFWLEQCWQPVVFNLPDANESCFEQLVTIVQQITQPSSESHSDMVTPEQSYP